MGTQRNWARPAEGVYIFRGQPTIALLTVCSANREPALANAKVQQALVNAWRSADAWIVGRYVIMPDHVHLFCAPENEDVPIEKWVTFWKRQFKRALGLAAPSWQTHGFHHRLRADESYSDKWNYVRANPVRAGLVAASDDWPYQGELENLRW